MSDETFFYLITTGHRSGKAHEIEIWFVPHNGCFYLCAEHGEKAHWVQNIQKTPQVQFRTGTRQTAPETAWRDGQGRVVDAAAPRAAVPRAAVPKAAVPKAAVPDLHAELSRLFDEKYAWSDGLFVEICPTK